MRGILTFIAGCIFATAVIALTTWLAGPQIMAQITRTIGRYQIENQPVVLEQDVKLYQGTQVVGVLHKGAVIKLVGATLDYPVLHYQISLVWQWNNPKDENARFKKTESEETTSMSFDKQP